MISDAQAAETMASALADRGIAVPADAPAAPAATSETLAPTAAAPTVDEQLAALNAPITGGQDVPEMAAAFIDPTVTPAAYDFGRPAAGVEAMPLEHQAQIRDFLAAEQIPAAIGTHLAKEWNAAVANLPTPEAIKQAESAVRADLARTHGSRAPAIIEAARGEIQRMAQSAPWLMPALAQTGLGNSRVLIDYLHGRATARKG